MENLIQFIDEILKTFNSVVIQIQIYPDWRRVLLMQWIPWLNEKIFQNKDLHRYVLGI